MDEDTTSQAGGPSGAFGLSLIIDPEDDMPALVMSLGDMESGDCHRVTMSPTKAVELGQTVLALASQGVVMERDFAKLTPEGRQEVISMYRQYHQSDSSEGQPLEVPPTPPQPESPPENPQRRPFGVRWPGWRGNQQ